MMKMNWLSLHFSQLTNVQLYQLIQQRIQVFSLEQNCLYQDLDNKDLDAYFILGNSDNRLIASTRLLKPGIAFKEISIGRVVCNIEYRHSGVGKLLMEKSINEIWRIYGKTPIRIGAQFWLYKFYTKLGFIQKSDIYLEDGIEHIEMLLSPN